MQAQQALAKCPGDKQAQALRIDAGARRPMLALAAKIAAQ